MVLMKNRKIGTLAIISITSLAAAVIMFSKPQQSIIECDTDMDCMEKNGGDGGPEPGTRPSSRFHRPPRFPIRPLVLTYPPQWPTLSYRKAEYPCGDVQSWVINQRVATYHFP